MRGVYALKLTPCCLLVALALVGCGALSTHQSPRLLGHREKAWTAGLGLGPNPNCYDTTMGTFGGNGCVLTFDPFIGWHYGYKVDEKDSANLAHGTLGTEGGVKFSGIPFVGGTILLDFRVQKLIYPVYLSYDFGLSIFPCLPVDHVEGETEYWICGDNPLGGGFYAGATVGKEWLYAGFRYGVVGNTWDGLQLLPGVSIGSALGTKRFKVIPALDIYFYQWPLDPSPSLRIIVGLGLQAAY